MQLFCSQTVVLFGVHHGCRVYRLECVCCCKVYSTVCVLQVYLYHSVCVLQGLQVRVSVVARSIPQCACVAGLSIRSIPQCACVAGLSIPQCVRVAGSADQSVSVVARSIPQCVCCRFVYTRVGGGGCCRVPISVFVVVGTIQQCLLLWGLYNSVCCGDYTTVFVVVGTIQHCLLLWGLYHSVCCCGDYTTLLLWGLYHSVCCCEDYTTLFVVARTIPQRLFLQGLYHSVLVFAGSVSDSACPSIRVPVAAEERPAAEVCPVSDQ